MNSQGENQPASGKAEAFGEDWSLNRSATVSDSGLDSLEEQQSPTRSLISQETLEFIFQGFDSPKLIQLTPDTETEPSSLAESTSSLRNTSKSLFQRLGILYSENQDITSPIHRTEGKFCDEMNMDRISQSSVRLEKLSTLADSINSWEDEIVLRGRNNDPKMFKKYPAPLPPVKTPSDDKDFIRKPSLKKTRAPDIPPKLPPRTSVVTDDRTDGKENPMASVKSLGIKDPAEMSLKERLALFEQNRGKELSGKPPVPKKPEAVSVGGIKEKIATLFSSSTKNQSCEGNEQQRRQEVCMLLNRQGIPTSSSNNSSESVFRPLLPPPPPPSASPAKRKSGDVEAIEMKTIVEEPKRVRTHQVGHSIAPNCAPLNVTRSYRPTEEDSSGDKFEAFSVHIRAAHGDNSGLAQSVLNSILNSTHEIGENDFDTSTSDLSGHFEEVDVCSEEDLDISTTSTDREPQEKGSISSDSFLFRPSPRKKLAFKQMREEVSDRSDCEDDGSPLLHSVSFYRKQQTHKVQYQQKSSDNTHFPYIDSPGLGDPQVEDDKPLIEEKIKKLNEEIHRQQQIISQTSQALNLCAATVEFSGSTESVEGERHLLVASHRRLAALSELQRIKVDKSLRSSDTSCERGSITVKGITLPLAQSYIRQMATETIPGHHLLCLLKYNETVLATQTIVTLPGLVGVKFSQDLHIPEVYADFKVTLEVYGMVAQREVLPHELKYHIFGKGPQSGKKFMGGTPLKRLRKPIIESPAGPQAVRSPAFNLYGSAIFSLKEIAKCTTWTLKRATLAPDLLDGVVHMNVVCQVNDSIEYRGFLTMFDEVSGFGAWHRRWCYLKGTTLNYWKYPDDEMKKMPIGSIDLHQCKSSKIDIVSRDICARLNTILLEVERPSTASDKESLILIRRGSKTIMRHLLSTDTKEEREQWMKNLNYVINLIKCWGSPE